MGIGLHLIELLSKRASSELPNDPGYFRAIGYSPQIDDKTLSLKKTLA